MRRSFFILPLAAALALALAGCGKKEEASASGGGESAAGTSPAAAAAAPVMPAAGLYQIKVEIAELSMPGMPAGMGDQLKKSMSTSMAHENCLTEADRADAVKKMTKGAENGSCKYTKYDNAGGKIDAELACDMGKGATANYKMAGTVSATGVDMTMASEQKNPEMPGGGMTMKMHMTSTRVGECKT